LITGLLYFQFGKSVEKGNNLLLETIHNPESVIPFRMAPLILLTTVLTHLCGGSAGREGTAIQMGGSLANLATGPLKLSKVDHRILIMAGIAGGFGSVFGTPIAGMIFGMEVLAIGRIEYDGLLPCLVASFVGDLVCRQLGIHHTVYTVLHVPAMTLTTTALVLFAGVVFAGASVLFVELTAFLHRSAATVIKQSWLRPVVGGVLVVLLALGFGRAYLGLGIPMIQQSFRPEGMAVWVFAVKILFTAVTLGFGFKGGEVTPLFCIGATLGSAFAVLTHQPPDFYAALGFVAVFAGAANTPIACIVMGVELFGSSLAAPLALACVVSYMLTGHRGIYVSQRVALPKGG
jgi:H+/Cl- antiporter ClcA